MRLSVSLIAATPTPARKERADPPHKRGRVKKLHSAAFCPFFFGPALFLASTGFKNRPV
jgi:hypothetical protein